VTLPTPALPPILPGTLNMPAEPEATPEPGAQATPEPQATPPPQFNPPTASSLNLPSAQPAGNPQYAPASVGMPSLRLDDNLPGGGTKGGALGDFFDWAKHLKFILALRGGYDSNVNSTHTNAQAREFANINGGVNYRFGTPRLNISADLTGGVTKYNQNQQLQETIGLGLSVEYRYSPKVVLTFNTSTSYQEQPNIALAGSANNSNNAFYYSANSFAFAYQWSELLSLVSRFSYTADYYPGTSTSVTQQDFVQPAFTQSFRWLLKPTTTAVLDYNTDNYRYPNQVGNQSWGQSLAFGFDHTFSPKWFWNFRGGAEFRTSQNSISGSSTYFGPYVDSNFSWALGTTSSVSWILHYGTQPGGQQNVSYATALRSGLNYSQGIFTKFRINSGIYYLLNGFNNAPYGPGGSLINYNQTNVQANLDLSYDLNRILRIMLGYQYLTSLCPSVPSQEYNRGISYLQIGGAF
jgi:hypothetical protein